MGEYNTKKYRKLQDNNILDDAESKISTPTLKENLGKTIKGGYNVAKDVANVGGDAYGAYSDIATLTGGDSNDEFQTAINKTSSTASLTGTGAQVGQKVVQNKMSTAATKILGGDNTKSILDITQLGEKAGKFANVASAVGGKVLPAVGLLSAGKDLADGNKTGLEKVGAVGNAAVAGVGLAASGALGSSAASFAAANFWNPAGWIAGAVAIGSTVASVVGGAGKFKPGKFRF